MIRLIATDIDGTLLQNGEKQINARFFTEAQRLMDKGVAVCAASGRQYTSLRRLFTPLADRMYFICENGAVVYGPGKTLLSHTVMERAKALALCEDILAFDTAELLISGTNTCYVIPKDSDFERHMREDVGNNTVVLSSPATMPEDFVKISACYHPGAVLAYAHLAPRWRDTFETAVAGSAWVDFTLANKATGIRALLQHLHLAPADVMAFGDNFNDEPMLHAVGHPYLMASAVPALREMFPTQCRRVEDILETL